MNERINESMNERMKERTLKRDSWSALQRSSVSPAKISPSSLLLARSVTWVVSPGVPSSACSA